MMAVPENQRIDLAREAPFTLGGAEIRPAQREFVSGAARESLEPRIMQVLTFLARHRDEVVSRDEMIAACWESRAVGDDAIVRCISRIRRLAESYGGFALETIPRVGYRLTEIKPDPRTEPALAVAAENGVEQASQTASAPPPARGWLLWARRYRVWIAAAVLLLAGAGLAWRLFGEPQKRIVVEAPPRQSIAVLPFTPLSPERQAFGDAAASMIAETLAKVGEPVVSPAESFQYRGSAKAKAAKALNAMYIVDGEVMAYGERLRVSVRLDDGVRGRTIFARTFEEDAAQGVVLTERIAAYVAAVSWGVDITHWDAHGAPEVLRSFEQQQRGDYYAAYETARQLATAKPDNGDVQRVYASAVMNLFYAIPAKRQLWLVLEGRRAAERSIAQLPGQAESHAALASATPHFLWAEREAHLRDALAANPASIGTAEYLAWLLGDTGRFRDAEPWARSAYERFPYHEVSFQRRAEQLLGAGDRREAETVLAQGRRLWPEYAPFYDLALEAAVFGGGTAPQALLRSHPSQKTAALWRVVEAALRQPHAAAIPALLRACAEPGEDWPLCLMALSALGRRDEAFAIAAQVYPDQRAPNRERLMQVWLSQPELPLTRYLFLPQTAVLRCDPRFAALVERIGLAQYWRATRHRPDFCGSEAVPVCRG